MNQKHRGGIPSNKSFVYTSIERSSSLTKSSLHLDRSVNPSSLLLLALFVLPLLINPVVALSFDEVFLTPKVLWIYAVLLPTALLVLWRGHRLLKPFLGVLVLLAVWVAWLILSTWINGAGWFGWWGATDRADGVWMHLIYAVLLLAGLIWTGSGVRARNLFERAVLVGGTLLALTNVLQQVGMLGIPGAGAVAGVDATPYGGTLGHRGYMGGALALLLPIVVVACAQRPQNVWRWLAVALIAWGWAGSFTRGPWLAGVAGLIWLLIWGRSRLGTRSWIAVVTGILLCTSTAIIREQGRPFSFKGGTAQSITDSSQREVLWKSAILGTHRSPITGLGTPALWRVMSTRPDNELVEEFGVLDVAHIRRISISPTNAPSFVVTHRGGEGKIVTLPVNKVHNEYLDYAVTYGILAGVLFTALLLWSAWSGRHSVPGISAGLIAYAVYLVTWPEVIRFAPIAWFMMGIALASATAQTPSSSQPRSSRTKLTAL